MAQINLTLDQEEILTLMKDSTGNAFTSLLQASLNAVLKAESVEQLKAQPYERTDKRTDSRNGVRSRFLTTRIGKIELAVPRHRNVPFTTLVFDNYQRSEAALITTMAEMVIGGVSTAKVGRVMEEICGKSFSKQTVSEACKELDSAVETFRNRPLQDEYLFVMTDATYIKVRENHKVVSKALLIAVGLSAQGEKEILGFNLADSETAQSWTSFLARLRKRGLRDIRMFTSDACEGIVFALQQIFPGVPWQRCQAHFTRNIIDKTPKHLQAGLRGELFDMFNSPTLDCARTRRDEIIADYSQKAPKAVETLDEGFDDAMTVMELPVSMRKPTRTSNIIERLNKEVKRRSKAIGIFPNAASVERLMGAVLMEENDRWQAKRKLFFKPAVLELDAKWPQLKAIARLQRDLRKAA